MTTGSSTRRAILSCCCFSSSSSSSIRDAEAPEYHYEAVATPLHFSVSPDAALTRPVLFSVKTKSNAACMQLSLEGQRGWSEPLPLNSIGLSTLCQMEESATHRAYCYSVSVSRAPGAFARTLVVSITPSFVLVNQTDSVLKVRQEATHESMILPPGETSPFHWSCATAPQRLQVLQMRGKSTWSPVFSPHCAGCILPFFPAAFDQPAEALEVRERVLPLQQETWSSMGAEKEEELSFLHVSTTSSHGEQFIFVQPCDASLLPFRFSNRTASCIITVHQVGSSWSTSLTLSPWQSQPWALPLVESASDVEICVRQVGEEIDADALSPCLRVNLDAPSGKTSLTTDMETISVTMERQGTVRELVFETARKEDSGEYRRHRVQLICCMNAMEDIQAAKRQEVAMCASTSERVCVLHVLYAYDVELFGGECASELGVVIGCSSSQSITNDPPSELDADASPSKSITTDSPSKSITTDSPSSLERITCSTPSSSLHFYDRVLVMDARAVARFTLTLSQDEKRVVACGELRGDVSEDESVIHDVVVPFRTAEGVFVCSLLVRLFHTRGKTAALPAYEIACLERQKGEVQRAVEDMASVLKREDLCFHTKRATSSSLPRVESYCSLRSPTGDDTTPSVSSAESERLMNVCVWLHDVRSIPLHMFSSSVYAVLRIGETQLRSPYATLESDVSLWERESVVVKCRAMNTGFELKEADGALVVSRLLHNSLAEHSGLRVGHVLFSVNRGKVPSSLAAFVRLMENDFTEKYLQFVPPPRCDLQRLVFEQQLFFPRGCTVGEDRVVVELYEEREHEEDVLLARESFPLQREESDWSVQTAKGWCMSVGVVWNEYRVEEEVVKWSVDVALRGVQVSVVSEAEEVLLLTVDAVACSLGFFEQGRCSLQASVRP